MKRLIIACMLLASSVYGQAANPGLLAWIATQDAGAWTAPTNGLVSYWSFDGDANDDFGNNTGTVVNATLTNGVGGTALYAYHFDGTGDYINMGDPVDGSLDFGTGDFSISYWFKTTGSATAFLVQKRDADEGYQTALLSAGTIQSFIDETPAAGGSQVAVTTASTCRDGNWHHAVMTRDSSSLRSYVDGTEDSNSPGDASAVGNTSNSIIFLLGIRYGSTDAFTGDMDEVRVYGKTLTSGEVTTLSQQFD